MTKPRIEVPLDYKSNGNGRKNDQHKELLSEKELINFYVPKLKLKFRNKSQKEFYRTIQDNEITFGIGPAGTGKSLISLYAALDLIRNPKTPYTEIIIIKPAVEAEEKLGYLPGTIEEKLDPYIYPSIYLLEKLFRILDYDNPKQTVKSLRSQHMIKINALAYVRGLNIDNAILIFEEAQNCTPGQITTLLTRIGDNTKYIINGDLDQSDRFKNKNDSGLKFAIDKLDNIDNIGIFEFGLDDQVRNPLISKMIRAFKN